MPRAARELLRAVAEQEIGRVTLLGFSQGADLALAGARTAYAGNLDTYAVAIGEPAGVEGRSMPRLAGDFLQAGAKDLKAAVEASGLNVQKQALGAGAIDFLRFGASAVQPANLRLYRGMTVNSFDAHMKEILAEGVVAKLVVAYGSSSAVTKPEIIEPQLQQLQSEHGTDSFISIKLADGKHTWGDQLTLLAKLYMRAAA